MKYFEILKDDDTVFKTNYCVIDGYSWGDRILEQVNFIFKINSNNEIEFVNVDKGSRDYCKQLNLQHWIPDMIKTIEDTEENGSGDDGLYYPGNDMTDTNILKKEFSNNFYECVKLVNPNNPKSKDILTAMAEPGKQGKPIFVGQCISIKEFLNQIKK